MPSDEDVELVIKLRPRAAPSEYASVKSTLTNFGIQFRERNLTEAPSSLDSYESVIAPREAASRAVEALKGNAAVESAFVKPRGETP
jgi:hypothetical protein